MYTTDHSIHSLGRIRIAFAALGGAWLASVAGYVDAVFYRLLAMPVTHVTGNAAALSADIARGKELAAWRIIGLIGTFILGAALSGIIVGSPSLRSGRRYGIALTTEGILLAASALVYPHSAINAAYLAAGAAGLQNAMASTYMGLIVRTTHLTGIATDIGFLIGCWVRGRKAQPWRLMLLLLLAAGFLVGAIAGTFAAGAMDAHSLWPVAACVTAVGLAYYVWRVRRPN